MAERQLIDLIIAHLHGLTKANGGFSQQEVLTQAVKYGKTTGEYAAAYAEYKDDLQSREVDDETLTSEAKTLLEEAFLFVRTDLFPLLRVDGYPRLSMDLADLGKGRLSKPFGVALNSQAAASEVSKAQAVRLEGLIEQRSAIPKNESSTARRERDRRIGELRAKRDAENEYAELMADLQRSRRVGTFHIDDKRYRGIDGLCNHICRLIAARDARLDFASDKTQVVSQIVNLKREYRPRKERVTVATLDDVIQSLLRGVDDYSEMDIKDLANRGADDFHVRERPEYSLPDSKQRKRFYDTLRGRLETIRDSVN